MQNSILFGLFNNIEKPPTLIISTNPETTSNHKDDLVMFPSIDVVRNYAIKQKATYFHMYEPKLNEAGDQYSSYIYKETILCHTNITTKIEDGVYLIGAEYSIAEYTRTKQFEYFELIWSHLIDAFQVLDYFESRDIYEAIDRDPPLPYKRNTSKAGVLAIMEKYHQAFYNDLACTSYDVPDDLTITPSLGKVVFSITSPRGSTIDIIIESIHDLDMNNILKIQNDKSLTMQDINIRILSKKGVLDIEFSKILEDLIHNIKNIEVKLKNTVYFTLDNKEDEETAKRALHNMESLFPGHRVFYRDTITLDRKG